MTAKTATLILEPHLRIHRAGYVVSVSNFTDDDGIVKHLLCLNRDGSAATCTTAARNGQFTIVAMEKRIRSGTVSRCSGTYRALCELADAAEALFGAKVQK